MKSGGDWKDYGRDPAKREVRRIWLEFAQKSLNRTGFGGAEVLCLPGADLWEVNEVYSHLPNLLPKNLTIVERNKLNARLMKASLPEAEVHAGELLELCETTKKKFDLISLDFCTEFGVPITKTLLEIRDRELLKDKAVIMLCVQARREKAKGKEMLSAALELASLHRTPQQAAEAAMMGDVIPDEMRDRSLSTIRGDAISHWMSSVLLGGSDKVYIQWVFEQKNDALFERIGKKALRKWAELLIRRDADKVAEMTGIPMEAVQGDTMDVFGVRVLKTGYRTNHEIEDTIKTIREGKMVISDEGEYGFDNETRTWTMRPERLKQFLSMFWTSAARGWQELKDEYRGDETVFLPGDKIPEPKIKTMMLLYTLQNLFKQSLMELFDEDLREDFVIPKVCRVSYPSKMGTIMFEYTMAARGKPYWITRHERYRYLSDSGCPMVVDMMKVDRTWAYNPVAMTSPEGKIVPYVPEKLIRRKDGKAIGKFIRDSLEEVQAFLKGVSVDCRSTSDMYPERIEVKGEEDMSHCANCGRLERELELLKSQLLDLKSLVVSKNKIGKKVAEVGTFDRAKIIEMIKANRPTEEISKELGVSPAQVRAVKAWITMKGEAYVQGATA